MSAEPVNKKLTPKAMDHDSVAADSLKRSALIERFFNSRLRLSQLRMLVSIAGMGQLKRVADALSVTPSAISKQVAEIEESLQVSIMTRVGNRIEFTPVGAVLARRAQELLAQLERTRIEVDELCSGVAGSVGLGVVPTVAPLFLPAMMLMLKNRAPNASIRIYEHHFDRLAPMLEEGTIDIALARETTHPLSSGFLEQLVMTDPLAIVCMSQHRLAQKRHLKWKDLEGVPWVLPTRGSSTYMHLQSLILRNGLTIPAGSIESNSLGATAGLLQAYPFVSLLSLAYVRTNVQANGLTVLALSTEGMQSEIKTVWRRDNENPIITILSEAIRQHVVLL